MDEEDFRDLVLNAIEAGLEGISEARITTSGIRLDMDDGSRWRLRLENLDDPDDDE